MQEFPLAQTLKALATVEFSEKFHLKVNSKTICIEFLMKNCYCGHLNNFIDVKQIH